MDRALIAIDAQEMSNIGKEVNAFSSTDNTGYTGNTGEISQLQTMLSQVDSAVACIEQNSAYPLSWELSCGS